MPRTSLACAATAALCFTLTATTGLASRRGRQKLVHVGEAAYFPVVQLYCLPEFANGAPRFHERGVACNTATHEYTGRGIWVSPTRIVITSPPNGRIIYSVRR